MKNMNRIKIVITIILAMFTIFGLMPIQALASNTDYTLIDRERVPIPKAYIYKTSINIIETDDEKESAYFKDPKDLFISGEFLFIADRGNDQIVKMDLNGNLVAVYKGPEEKPLKSPSGLFVDENGDIFIADTGNNRIVHLTAEGDFIEEFTKPESELLSEDFVFNPSKICVTPTGYIYAIKGESIMIIDAYNRFRGYIGQSEIEFSLVNTLIRIFASEEQKRAMIKTLSATYINMTMDETGMLYATSYDRRLGEIKKLNSIGVNIYREYGQKSALEKLLEVSLESESFRYGERFDDEGEPIEPIFTDIAIDNKGNVTVIEEITGKIYQYDQQGNILLAFGGKGEQKGLFEYPVAIDVDDQGRIYVLDSVRGNIQIFEPTSFTKKVHQATYDYLSGNYEEAYTTWNEVLSKDEYYTLAHIGIAQSLYKKEQYDEALEEYRLADDRVGYSKVFTEYRYEKFRNNFVLVFIIFIAGSVLFIYLFRFIKAKTAEATENFQEIKSKKMSIWEGIKVGMGVVFRPLETFRLIKNGRGRLNMIPGVICLLLVLFARLFYIFTVHFPLADIDINSANFVVEAVKVLVPPLTWIIASYAVTSILVGESRLREIVLATAYCMIPYILMTIIMGIASHLMARDMRVLHSFVINGTRVWTFVLYFLSLKELNDYKNSKAVLAYVTSGITMIMMWLLCILGYVLAGRFYKFIEGIIREIRLM